MIYSPLITAKLQIQASTKGGFNFHFQFQDKPLAGSDCTVLVTIDEDTPYTQGVLIADVTPGYPIAWSDGTIADAEFDNFDNMGRTFTAMMLLESTVKTTFQGQLDMASTEPVLPGTDKKEWLDEWTHAATTAGTSEFNFELGEVLYRVRLTLSSRLYYALALRAPEVAMHSSSQIEQATAFPALTCIFGSDRSAYCQLFTSTFYNKLGVDDDLSKDWFAHSGSEDACVKNSRNLWAAKIGHYDTAFDNERYYTAAYTSVPQALVNGMGLPSAKNPIHPTDSRNYPTTRWGSGVIDALNQDYEAGYRRRRQYSRNPGMPSSSDICTYMSDLDLLGHVPFLYFREQLRQFECVSHTFFWDLWATGVLTPELIGIRAGTYLGSIGTDVNKAITDRGGNTYEWLEPVAAGCFTLINSVATLQHTAVTVKQIVRQEEAVGSSLAVDADFLNITFTNGVIETNASPSAWFEPETYPSAEVAVNEVLAQWSDALQMRASHGVDDDWGPDLQYDKWYMNVDGSTGAWRSLRHKESATTYAALAGTPLHYWGTLTSFQSDITLDNNGTMSASKIENFREVMGLGQGYWAPTSNGLGSTTVPGRVAFVLGNDESDSRRISVSKWYGHKSAWYEDDDYSGYLLGRVY